MESFDLVNFDFLIDIECVGFVVTNYRNRGST